MSALDVPALMGAAVSRNPRKRVLFLALAVVGLVAQDEEEQERTARRQRRRLWWNAAMNKRAPVLSKSIGGIRTRRFFGVASNYGRHLAIQSPMSPAMFYSFFRFSREDAHPAPRSCTSNPTAPNSTDRASEFGAAARRRYLSSAKEWRTAESETLGLWSYLRDLGHPRLSPVSIFEYFELEN